MLEKIVKKNRAAAVLDGTEVLKWDTQSDLDVMKTAQKEK